MWLQVGGGGVQARKDVENAYPHFKFLAGTAVAVTQAWYVSQGDMNTRVKAVARVAHEALQLAKVGLVAARLTPRRGLPVQGAGWLVARL
jgi:hypothetical protein